MTRKRRSFRPLSAKKELLRKKLADEGLDTPRDVSRKTRPIPRRDPGDDPAPLSFGQERLWFLDRLQPGLATYLIPSPVRLSGRLRVAAVVQTLEEILRRHQVLRTRFEYDEGRDERPRQRIDPARPLRPGRVDLSGLAPEDRATETRRLVDAEARRPLDLESGRLLRAALLRREPREHVLTLTLHHIASDGLSAGILMRELSALYRAFFEGRPSTLWPLPLQYADFAVWQRNRLAGETGEEHLAWWKERLDGVPPVLDLPRDRPRPALPSHRGDVVRRRLTAGTVEGLDRLGRERRASRFMTLTAAFAAFLHRLTGRHDLLVGTPAGHRDRPELEGLIGFFVNTLPLRLDLSGDPPFSEVVDRVRRTTLESFEHQEMPFEKLLDALAVERDARHSPLVQVMVSTGVGSSPAPPELPDLELAPQPFGTAGAKLDLLLHATFAGGRLDLAFEYATDLWDRTSVERFARELESLLDAALGSPETSVGRLSLLDPGRRHQIVAEWGASRSVPAPAPSLHRAFVRRARRQPDAVAVVCEDRHLTYGDLDRRSGSLARRLRSIDLGDPVALCLDREPALPVAVLGVLRAGGAYLPLEPDHPDRRLSDTLEDARVNVLITTRDVSVRRPALVDAATRLGVDVVLLDETLGRPTASSFEERRTARRIPPESAAYVIYTSGSTGRPKGVVVSHRQALRLFSVSPFAIGSRDVWTLFHSYAFDFSVWELWGALLFGGRLVIVPYLESRAPEDFHRLLSDERVTVLSQTPSAFRQLDAADAAGDRHLALRHVVFGGEALDPAGLASWFDRHGDGSAGRGPRLVNMYGITETTVHVTSRTVYREDAWPGAPSDVGRPLADLRVHVLHPRSLEPQPLAAPGEMWVGGAGVARGYLHRPGLTADRFRPDPFSETPGERLYRSGDLARRAPRGELIYLGRLDQQVKVRGFRIELGEIETALTTSPDVGDAVVVPRDDGPGDRRLVAYVVPRNAAAPPSAADLRSHVAGRMPTYMVPAAFVVLDELPLNANGKLDRDALPAPGLERPEPDDTWAPPQTDAESVLARVWGQVLRLERVGRHDHFFELGGDSILSIQIVARARREGLSLKPQDVFLHPTVAELARVAATRAAPERLPEQGPVTGAVPLTPMQRALVLEDPVDLDWFNQALLLASPEPLGTAWLAQAVDVLLGHHDALRLRLRHGAWGWAQEILPPGNGRRTVVPTVDLTALRAKDRPDALEAAAGRAQATLHLEHGPLVRAVRFRLAGADDIDLPERLLLAIHHLAVDGVSWRILMEDLQTARRDLRRGLPVDLPPKTHSFQAWARVQDRRARERPVTDELDHWIGVEVDTPPPLPVDRVAGPHPQADSRTVVVPLPEEPTRALLTEVPAAYRTGIDDVLLTALTRAVARWTGVPRLRVDLEGHGRDVPDEDLDLSRTVGWFTSLYPVHLSVEGVSEPGPALQAVKEQIRAVPGRGQGYGLLRYVNQELHQGGRLRRIAARHPGSQVSFNYLGQTDMKPSRETATAEAENSTDVWQPAEESSGAAQSPRRRRPHALAVSGAVAGGRLMMRFGYSPRAHREETIGNFAVSFREELLGLIEHCRRPGVRGATPSDFPLAEIDQPTVDRLFAEYGPVEDVYPLSPLQEGMLFHTLAEPGRHFYFEQMTAVLEGELDATLLRRALDWVVDRHPVLRTVFVWDGVDRPVQVVLERVQVPWTHLDWRNVPGEDRPRRLERLLAEDRRRGFDLTRPPLLRATLIRLGGGRVRLVWSWHHLLLDGWSVPRVLGELFSAYEALAAGEEPRAPRVRPYGDYIAWLARQDRDEAEVFWRGLLGDVSEPTPLPVPSSRHDAPDPGDGEDRRRDVLLPADVTTDLESRARDLRVTVNSLVQGALAILLARHGGVGRVIFGATTSGRPTELAGVEDMVGLFINSLPVSVEVDPRRELGPWLRDLQDLWSLARRFEHTPLARIQRFSGMAEGTPLFQTLLVFENYPRGEALRREEGTLKARGFETLERTNYPLTFVAAPGPRLALRLAWPAGRFDATSVERLHGHLQALLHDMARRPDATLGDLSLLPDGERHQVMHEWSTSPAGRTPGGAVVSTLGRIAADRPDAVAVTTGDRFLTYGELDRRSRRWARDLQARGVGPEVPVAVRLPRSMEQIVTLAAVLQAGGVYLPLDPSYPAERLAFMATDAGSEVEIDSGGPQGRVSAPPASGPCDAPERLAYLIYTSGSTGRPKGVGVSHGALAHLCFWHADAYGAAPGVHAAQTAGLSFDASIAEILPYLVSGATLHLAPDGERLDPEALRERWVREGVEVAFLPTPLAEAALDAPWPRDTALRTLLTAGERLRRRPPSHLPFRLVNNYGPTENAVASSFGVVTPQPVRSSRTFPSIGRPISGTQVAVVDGDLRPVPLEAPGELCLAGGGLARGYLGRPGATARAFLPHPFAGNPGERLYRTGDRVRFLSDGRLDFLGRLDDQVQVRGVRVEPGEVEAVLLEHPRVAEAAVAARVDAVGTRLVAWVVPHRDRPDDWEPSDLRRWLAQRLPDPMMPAAFVEMDALPLSPSGKVDRRRLPAPDLAPKGEKTTPRTESERILAAVWEDLLGVEEIGVDDDFFDLGGDSILSIQVASRARRRGLELSPGQVFDHPTVAGQAAVARRAEAGSTAEPPIAESEPGPAPLTPIQRWFFEEHPDTSDWFNQSVLLTPRRRLAPALLTAAVLQVTARHEALRLQYRPDALDDPPDGEPPSHVHHVDLTGLPDSARPRVLTATATEVQASFRPARGRVFQAVGFDLGGEQRLFLAAHHLAVDAVSWRLLLDDLETSMEHLENGVPATQAPALPFRRWAHRLRELAAAEDTSAELDVWNDPRRRESLRLPLDGVDDAGTASEARRLVVQLSTTQTRALRDAAPRRHRARLEDVLLAALFRAVAAWAGDRRRKHGLRLLVDLESHGRDEGRVGLDASRSVGWFTSLYPVLLTAPESDDLKDWVAAARRDLQRVPGTGLGWGLLRYLSPDPEIRRSLAELPRPQIVFNYLGRLDAGFEAGHGGDLGRFAMAGEDTGPETSPRHRREHLLSVDAAIAGDRLGVRLTFSPKAHEATSLEALAGELRKHFEELAGDLHPTSPLVQLGEAAHGPPVVCAHAAAGRSRGYEALARELAGELPVWGLEARGLEGEPPRDDVGDMASAYLEAVDGRWPDRPVVLLGWSFGALVAAEMGRRRLADGRPVARLVVIDQEPELAGLPEGFDEVDWILDLAGPDLPLDADELRTLPDREARLARAFEVARAAGRVPPGLDRSQARNLFDVWLANHRAGTRWSPRPYPGDVLVFRAADNDLSDPTLGWEALAPGRVEVVELPGEHRGLLTGDSGRHLARHLRTRLALSLSSGVAP